jgi:rhodanese-related sulfurtransferase
MEHLGQFILNHWQLCLAFVTILLLLFINEAMTQKKRAKELSPQAAINMINHDNANVIDLRDKEHFIIGHIIDSTQTNSSDFEQKSMEKYKKKPLILVCARGVQSAALADKLRNQGFENLFVLQGGIEAWQKAGLPLVKGKAKPALRAVN